MTPGQTAQDLLDALAVDLMVYRAGHRCRRCQAHITDMEYLSAGLFLSLCPLCMASARQTLRETSV